MQRPKIGVGIILLNEKGEVLVGKRLGNHAPLYSIPGGHLEIGESFEEAATREMLEETGVKIVDPIVSSISNNIETYKSEGIHTVSVNVMCREYNGKVKNLEPHKCEDWIWMDPKQIIEPHFEASKNAITCYLKNTFY